MKFSLIILLSSLLTTACASKPKTESPINHEAFRQSVRGGLKEIRGCYNELLKTEPKAEGKVVVEMTIDSEGKAAKVATIKEKSTMTEPNFLNCINTKIASWKFPPAPPKTVAEVNYPFYFRKDPGNLDKFISSEEAK